MLPATWKNDDVSVPNVLAGRYASGAMRAIWAPESKINAERRLWIAVMRAQAAAGLDIPDATIADYGSISGPDAMQKEIFNRRRKKVSAAVVVETLVESGAKSQSDKRLSLIHI